MPHNPQPSPAAPPLAPARRAACGNAPHGGNPPQGDEAAEQSSRAISEATRLHGPHFASSAEAALADSPAEPLVSLSQSGRARIASCLGFRIAATGVYLPEAVITNEDLARLGCDSDWIVQRTGIRQRHRAADDQATSDLAYAAAVDCLRRAGVQPGEVDLIVVATITPDHATPSTACLLQERLGCIAPAFDLNAACSGFVYALAVAAQFVASGAARNALVVGAEVMTRTIDPHDVKTYPLFGDGAGAVLLQPAAESIESSSRRDGQGGRPGLLAYSLGSEGVGGPQLCIPAGGSRQMLTAAGIEAGEQYLQMDGRSVFKWAVRVIRESCHDVLSACGLQAEQIDSWVLHQANIRIMESAMQDFAIDRERLVVNVDRVGNTSAASVAIALHDAIHEGSVRRGDLVMLCGFGAGLTWGTAVLRY